MNRKIKFRVWDKSKREFLPYPCFLNHLNPNEFTCFDEWFSMDRENCVLQQFTGIKDKDGKEIYEGDLLSFSCNHTVDCGDPDITRWDDQEVYYDEALAGFYFGQDGFQMLDKIIPDTLGVTSHIFKAQKPDESLNEISEIAQKMGLY